MHRKRMTNLGIVRRIQAKLGLFRYCGCRHCTTYGGTWRKNHSSRKYVTPVFLRPFDELRHQWSETVYAFKVMLDL